MRVNEVEKMNFPTGTNKVLHRNTLDRKHGCHPPSGHKKTQKIFTWKNRLGKDHKEENPLAGQISAKLAAGQIKIQSQSAQDEYIKAFFRKSLQKAGE